jgi:hypothetical protein
MWKFSLVEPIKYSGLIAIDRASPTDSYFIGENIFEVLAYLGVSVLCWKNWRRLQILS